MKAKWNPWESGAGATGLCLILGAAALHVTYDNLEGNSQENVWHQVTEFGLAPAIFGAILLSVGLIRGNASRWAMISASLVAVSLFTLIIGRGGPGWHYEEPNGCIPLCVFAILCYMGALAACVTSRVATELRLDD